MIFFGDPVISWRQLIKRYVVHETVGLENYKTGNSQTIISKWVFSDFPSYRGYMPNEGRVVNSNGDRWNCCNMTPLNLIAPCFLMNRGGLKYKYVMIGASNAAAYDFSIYRSIGRSVGCYDIELGSDANTAVITEASSNERDMRWQGTALSMRYPRGYACAAEFPYHSNRRFRYGRMKNVDSSTFGPFHMRHTVDCSRVSTSNNQSQCSVDRYVCASDDFTMHYFLNVPALYISHDAQDIISNYYLDNPKTDPAA